MEITGSRADRLCRGRGLSGALASPAVAVDTLLGEVDGVAYWKDSTAVSPPGNGNLSVSCPPGTKVSGGGWGQSGLSGEMNDSFPLSNDGWAANVLFDPSGTLDVYAICNGGARSFVDAERQLEAGKTQKLKVKCPGGKHLMGGGAVIFGAIADARLNSSYPYDSKDQGSKPDDGWRARGVNLSGDDFTFQVFAICASKQFTYRSEKTNLGPSTSSGLSPFCPNSEQVLSGGVRLSGPGPEGVVHALLPIDGGDGNTVPDDGFLANGHNLLGASGPKTLTGYAICG